MRKVFRLIMIPILGLFAVEAWAVTYVYVQNNSSNTFQISAQQTGTHTMDPGEWWVTGDTLAPWEPNKNVLWTNRDQGVHNGDFFFFDIRMVAAGDTITLQVQLEGEFVGSHMWQSAAGPGFNHAWYDDRNFHSETFSFAGKTFTLKYTAYATGGDDDILFAIQEHDPWPVVPSNDHTLDVLAYNVFMLTPPTSLSEQEERAAILPDHIGGYDAVMLSEAFDNTSRGILTAGLATQYPYQTRVVDAGGASEDGGVLIVSKWPIIQSTYIVYDSCDGSDCLAAKGAMYAKIDKNGVPYHLFATHTQAWQSGLMYRSAQLRQLRDFISAINIPSDEAVLVGGDLNVDKVLNNQNEYTQMFSILRAGEPAYIGKPFTYDPGLNLYASGNDFEYLDYVLHLNDYLHPTDSVNEVVIYRSVHDDVWEQFDLSDHFAVRGHFEFPNTLVHSEAPVATGPGVRAVPNPFREVAQLVFDLPEATRMEIRVYDLTGMEIARPFSGRMEAGVQTFRWNAQDLPAGVYLYRIQAGEDLLTERVVKLN